MIRLEVAGAVAVATLQRPPVNAIHEAWVARLREVIDAARGCSVLLIRSDRKVFCAGAGGYELELEATGTLLASAETQARVRAFLEQRR
jgi:Fe-S oxidoreductase